jgi:hypothetical protein
MWQISNPEIRTGRLDFSSSGQGTKAVSQLYSDDIQLMNAIELVGWEMDEDQFLICEGCGFVHCKSGDWVSLRAAGPLILVIPAFGSYFQDGEVNTEYSPPVYLRKRGIPYFDVATYEELRATNASFPPIERIHGLEMWEAILAFQWDAPLQAFGRPPAQFAQREDLVIASSEGEHTEQVRWIESIARANLTNRMMVLKDG